MKVSKVFGFVLCLHLGAITVLIMQPGCRTTQPPTQTFQQEQTLNRSALPTEGTEDIIPSTFLGEDMGLDAAFNAGMDVERSSPRRPSSEFAEFDQIQPLQPIDSAPTVNVAGTSVETYVVKKGDSLWAISKAHNVSLNELLSLNGLSKTAPLKIGQEIKIPVEGGSATVSTITADSYQPSAYNVATQNYTVARGDSLSKIAKKYGTSVSSIKAANNKSSDMIQVGEKLLIPVSGTAPVASAAVTTRAPSVQVNTDGERTHVVKTGEYPATIARKYGMTSSELLAINGITDPRKLQVGQKLKVSASGSAQNVDSRIDTVNTSNNADPIVAPASNGPVQIRVIEADPLIEEEAASIEFESVTVDTDSLFDGAVEIPVIRMEE